MSVKILGTGSYAPEKVLTNFDLEKMVDTSDEWIRTRTGIEERHVGAKDEAASDIALKACQRALEMSGVNADEIDLMVVATVSGDKPFPSTSCYIQRKLEAFNSVCFDIQAACSGFLFGLDVANSMMTFNPSYKKALVLGVEKITYLTDWTDRNTCVLFGDGSGAVVLERSDDDTSGLVSAKLACDGRYTEILVVPAGGSAKPIDEEVLKNREQFITMAGSEVFKLAVNMMVGACKEVLEKAGLKTTDIRWLIPHQANKRIIGAVGKRLNLTERNVFINVNKYGNTSAASIPIALDEIVRTGQIERGEYLLLTAFGAGLTWGASLIKW
ncbi:MAG: ketoacyl-ACP synthase III [Kiritimatiellaeota bacterium]|nr:ketoacyl-ACP synthase III [Kiritimatiellota bacterium]